MRTARSGAFTLLSACTYICSRVVVAFQIDAFAKKHNVHRLGSHSNPEETMNIVAIPPQVVFPRETEKELKSLHNKECSDQYSLAAALVGSRFSCT